YSQVKEALEKNNYKTKTISLLGGAGGAAAAGSPVAPPPPTKIGAPAVGGAKPEVPADCTVLIVAGPKYDYAEPEVAAIKTYVESGGHALFMIDPPLKLGREDNAGSPALAKVIEGWGVTLNKDLALDT